MLDFLINSNVDITLLTCESCAIDIYEELVNKGFEFFQSEKRILEEIENSNGVVEITKLVSNFINEEDVFFVFGMEDEKELMDRIVVIDSCVEDCVDEDMIPRNSMIIMGENHEEDEYEEEDDYITDLHGFINSLVYGDEVPEEDEYEEDCECDECLTVNEILDNIDLSVEDALREAYRAGKVAALVELAEEIEDKNI